MIFSKMVAVLHSYGPPFNIFFWYPLFPVLSHTDSERTWSLRNVTSLWIRTENFPFHIPHSPVYGLTWKIVCAAHGNWWKSVHFNWRNATRWRKQSAVLYTDCAHTDKNNSVNTGKFFFGKLWERRKCGWRENGKPSFIHLFFELFLPSVLKNRFFVSARVVVGFCERKFQYSLFEFSGNAKNFVFFELRLQR